jgi:hypothetical protein
MQLIPPLSDELDIEFLAIMIGTFIKLNPLRP